jgi:hypothetical protein
MIEGESFNYSELLNYNLACTVSEAPILIGEMLKYSPGNSDLRFGNLMDHGELERKNFAPSSRARVLSPRALSKVSVSSTT